MATRRELRERGYFGAQGAPRLDSLFELVALGTVADMVPLTGANRVFTRIGLESLQQSIDHDLTAAISPHGVGSDSHQKCSRTGSFRCGCEWREGD